MFINIFMINTVLILQNGVKYDFFQPLETFFCNVCDSFSLKDIYRKTAILNKLKLDEDLLLEQILYSIPNFGIKRQKKLTTQETIKEVITTNKNFMRFDDREIKKVLEKIDIPYQKADINIIKDIIKIPIKNLLVGVNHNHCYPNPISQVIEQKNVI